MTDGRRVSFERLQAFIAEAFATQGFSDTDSLAVARLMAQADLQGSDGHGVIRLGQYLKRIQSGGINIKPQIQVVRERPASALIDGDNGMGHLVVSKAVGLAAEKARSMGVAWVGTRFSNHAGPASLYVRALADQDLIGIYYAVGNANHLPPWGGMDMLLSTNPIAIAFPRGHQEPSVVLDMATTVAAYGKVKAKARKGEMMPEGWMIDRQGRPLLDPNKAAEGFLLPIGGHKGYGLALLVGMLAGSLNGAAMGSAVIDFNMDSRSITNTGQTSVPSIQPPSMILTHCDTGLTNWPVKFGVAQRCPPPKEYGFLANRAFTADRTIQRTAFLCRGGSSQSLIGSQPISASLRYSIKPSSDNLLARPLFADHLPRGNISAHALLKLPERLFMKRSLWH